MHTDEHDEVQDSHEETEAATGTNEDAATAEGDQASVDADDGDAGAAEVEEAEVVVLPDPRDARIEALEAELKESQARLRAVSKAFTDQKAEMAAFRDRLEARSKAREALRGVEAVKAFFDPVQNLQRSIEAGGSDPEAFMKGIQMVHKQFQSGLDKLGLERVPGVGADFDPNIHEALAVMPVPEAAQDGKVLMVHVDGYMVAGKSIQAAQVVIGKHTPAPEPAPEPEAAEPEAAEPEAAEASSESDEA